MFSSRFSLSHLLRLLIIWLHVPMASTMWKSVRVFPKKTATKSARYLCPVGYQLRIRLIKQRKSGELVHHVANCGPVRFDATVTLAILVSNSFKTFLQFSVTSLGSSWCFSAICCPHSASRLSFFVLQLSYKDPQIRVSHLHLSVPTIVKPFNEINSNELFQAMHLR